MLNTFTMITFKVSIQSNNYTNIEHIFRPSTLDFLFFFFNFKCNRYIGNIATVPTYTYFTCFKYVTTQKMTK